MGAVQQRWRCSILQRARHHLIPCRQVQSPIQQPNSPHRVPHPVSSAALICPHHSQVARPDNQRGRGRVGRASDIGLEQERRRLDLRCCVPMHPTRHALLPRV
eukprot:2682279-Amphidinium_carterae.1